MSTTKKGGKKTAKPAPTSSGNPPPKEKEKEENQYLLNASEQTFRDDLHTRVEQMRYAEEIGFDLLRAHVIRERKLDPNLNWEWLPGRTGLIGRAHSQQRRAMTVGSAA